MLDKSGLNRAFQAAALVTGITVLTGSGSLLGYLADKYVGTEPWLFLLGTFGGFAAGVLRLFQAINRLDSPPDDDPPDHPS